MLCAPQPQCCGWGFAVQPDKRIQAKARWVFVVKVVDVKKKITLIIKSNMAIKGHLPVQKEVKKTPTNL